MEKLLKKLGLLALVLLYVQLLFAQQKTITGKVVDSNNEPLPGVTVVLKGTIQGTVTDMDGKYTIETVNAESILQFSFVGMRNEEIKVENQTSINVTLHENAIGLEEIVAVGYGVQKKATLSGSVTVVGGDKLSKAPVTNVSNSLAGRLPGVVIMSGTSEPGNDDATIRIRGVNTYENSSPLIVVDGVPGRSLSRIDANSIESVTVLKDASAAIYGAQAANGVILITTKRGKVGKPSLVVSHNRGFAKPTRIPEMASSAEYAQLLNEISSKEVYSEEEIELFRNGSDPWKYPNTDWFAETMKPWSQQNMYNVSLSGGSENVKYFVSGGYKTQDGFYKNSGTKYDQYDFRSNLDGKINEYIDLNIDISGRLEDRNYPTRSSYDIFRMLMRGKPQLPAYWPNGMPGPDIEYGDNPVVVSTKETGYQRDKKYVVNSNFGINIKIPWIDGLSIKANAAIDNDFQFVKIWRTPWNLYTWDYETYDESGDPLLQEATRGYSEPNLEEKMSLNSHSLLNGMINYSKTIAGSHNINMLIGIERIKGSGDYFKAYRRYYISEIDQLFAGGTEEMDTDGSGYMEARLNYFGRLNYNFNTKYMLEFVWRYQGSYIFEKESRFGFFPGISLGYVISEEGFWKNNVPFINYAKIRGSWGQTGNDLIAPYQYMSNYKDAFLNFIHNDGASAGYTIEEDVVPNKNVTWETAIQRNVGVDFQMLGGKLAFTADYFHNLRKDILAQRNESVPQFTGMTLPKENIGEVENKGFDFNVELRDSYADFSYSIGLNGGYAKNKILFWDEPSGQPDYQQSTGKPINTDLYYQTIGIFRDEEHVESLPHWNKAKPGDIIFKDVDENGIIDENDMVRNDQSNVPTFTGGMNISFMYKGFDLTMLFQGAAGAVFYQYTESGSIGNFLKSFYDSRWTEDNPNATGPRTYNRSNEYFINQQNDYWLKKTDYIRLKNFEIGYNLSSSIASKLKVDNIRLYGSGYNLLTFSPDMQNFDPESAESNGFSYPLQKVLNLGMSITF
ncbi:MAG: SusC/RagA family TonB-linked outer membrane protein [Prolixibacteraceae bacterium]